MNKSDIVEIRIILGKLEAFASLPENEVVESFRTQLISEAITMLDWLATIPSKTASKYYNELVVAITEIY